MQFKLALCWALTLVLVGAGVGCGGSAIRRDARRLEKKCGVVRGSVVTKDQARCIAKIFGVRHKKKCPMEVDRPEGFGGSVYRVRESCTGVGVVVSEANGRVVAVVLGDDVIYD